MLRLYAVVPLDRKLPQEPAAGRLSVLRRDDLAVVYDEIGSAPDKSPNEILGFGRMLTELAAGGPMLPVRYGTTVADLEELEQTVEQHAAGWRRRLQAVAGHVEMIVHVAEPETPARTDTGSGSGRDYLMAKVRAHSWARERYDELLDAVEPHVHDVRRLPDRGPGLRIAFLVPQVDVDRFRDALARSAAGPASGRTRVTGPWPPFSFAEEEDQP